MCKSGVSVAERRQEAKYKKIMERRSAFLQRKAYVMNGMMSQMLCYAMLCYATLYAMVCYLMLCYAMLCYVMLWYAMLCYAMLC